MKIKDLVYVGNAEFSDDNKHRYYLHRIWGTTESWLYIMLNPSTANEQDNDSTIESCMRIAWNNDAGSVHVVNLFSFITDDPKVLYSALKHAKNDLTNHHIKKQLSECDKVICAWGNWDFTSERVQEVTEMIFESKHKQVYCLKENINGSPRHPLYMSGKTKPKQYTLWQNI
jgi:hypothetical protein